MALLTDTSIREILCKSPQSQSSNELLINPFDEDSLTPVGYDLRVGNLYSSKRGETYNINTDEFVEIFPGDTVLIRTLENISMPKDKSISAIILSKVSKVSKGLSHISTTIDADWSGYLLIAINNHSVYTG